MNTKYSILIKKNSDYDLNFTIITLIVLAS
jgi:hypothetical protein